MSDSHPPPNDALSEATQMVKNGRLDQARETLMQYLMKNPSSEQAWLLMSYVLSDPAKQKDCLERVLKINPNNTVAQSKLAHLLGRRTEELFKRKTDSRQPVPEKSEFKPKPLPVEAPKTGPAHAFPSEPETVPEEKPDAGPVPAPASSPPSFALHPFPVRSPDSGQNLKNEPPSETEDSHEQTPPDRPKSPLSGKGFRITTIVLIVLMLIIAAVILYVGVIAPAINLLSVTPVLTNTPVTVEFPQQWTQTLTPTQTPVPPPTDTPEPPVLPSETTIL
jgi:hypothetical protein